LDVFFQFVKQKAKNYDFGTMIPGLFSRNQPVSVLDRWQKAGDVKPIQRFNSDFSAYVPFLYAESFSDAAYSDASYIRLKNISLSWQFPKEWVKRAQLQNIRVYAQAQNLLTITNYKGLDPETRSSTSLPPLRVITVGLQVNL
jgi:hypothetical protein